MENIAKQIVLEQLVDSNGLHINELVPLMVILDCKYADEQKKTHMLHTTNNDYYEETIPKYNLDEFKEHFRMSRMCFEKLLCVVAENYKAVSYSCIPIDKKLLLTVWLLSKEEFFLSVSDRFRMASSTGHYIFTGVVEALAKLKKSFIKFPNVEGQKLIAENFRLKCQIPGIVGAFDGCHIPIKQPPHNPTDFYNRKGFHSIVLQGVCDHELKFIDVFVGMPGRVHDSRIFKCSPLFKLLESAESPIGPNNHLMADSAYGACNYMITPYKDNGHLTKPQSIYNTRLCSVRSVIERAYALLKGKFRKLKYLDINNCNFAVKNVVAACVLHNFILLEDGITEDQFLDVAISDDFDATAQPEFHQNKKKYFVSLF